MIFGRTNCLVNRFLSRELCISAAPPEIPLASWLIFWLMLLLSCQRWMSCWGGNPAIGFMCVGERMYRKAVEWWMLISELWSSWFWRFHSWRGLNANAFNTFGIYICKSKLHTHTSQLKRIPMKRIHFVVIVTNYQFKR